MNSKSNEHQQPLTFRDTVTGLVWQMTAREINGAVYKDTKYNAQMRLADPTVRELIRQHRFIKLTTAKKIRAGRPTLLTAA